VARETLSAAAQLRVHGGEHRADAVHPVGGDQVHRLFGTLPLQKCAQGRPERPLAQAGRHSLLEDREVWVELGEQRVGAQHACAEAVEGAYERRLGVTRGLAFSEGQEACPHALAQLTRGPVGERDREDLPGRELVLADGSHEALDEHRGLPAASARGQQQRLATATDGMLLLVGQSHRDRIP
jgi:hypothetical protein